MPSPLAEAFLMGSLNSCYETPSKKKKMERNLLSYTPFIWI